MPKIYRISKAGLRLFYKVRHHRGHGVHSPFVFNLITKVIEEKSHYYAYKDIQEAVFNHSEIHKKVSKYDLLSFRLVNYFNAENIWEIGSGEGINTLCLTAPSGRIVCNCFEPDEEKYKKAELLYKSWNRNISLYKDLIPKPENMQDCVYINLMNYLPDYQYIEDYIYNKLHNDSFMIIRGIRTKKIHQALWKMLRKSEKVTVSLDLYKEGILFFNKKLYKRNYKISF